MTVEERLERLEQQNRRIKVAASVLVVALCAVALLAGPLLHNQASAQAASAPRVVEANEFRLMDDNGKVRAKLCMDRDGPSLDFFNENRKTGASLSVGRVGPLLALYDKSGDIRLGLEVGLDGPVLGLYDEDFRRRAAFGVHRVTTPSKKIITYPASSLLLFDAESKVIWKAP